MIMNRNTSESPKANRYEGESNSTQLKVQLSPYPNNIMPVEKKKLLFNEGMS